MSEADRAEDMGQTWIAGMLRRRAAGEAILYRKACRECGLYFEPAGANDAYCSDSCKEGKAIYA